MDSILINEYQIQYVEKGSGEPVLFVHGSLSDYRSWLEQLEFFSRTHRALSLSLRHCYPDRWDGKGDTFSIDQHVDDLRCFIQQLDLAPVHLVGHSRAGALMVKFLSLYPELCQTVCLIDPAPLRCLLPGTAQVARAIADRNSVVDRALTFFTQDQFDQGLKLFTDAVGRPGAWDALLEPARQVRRDNCWSLSSLVADAEIEVDVARLRSVTLPVLLITGDRSPAIYGMMHDCLESIFPDYKKVVVPQASHGVHRDQPQIFNNHLIDFISRNGENRE